MVSVKSLTDGLEYMSPSVLFTAKDRYSDRRFHVVAVDKCREALG